MTSDQTPEDTQGGGAAPTTNTNAPTRRASLLTKMIREHPELVGIHGGGRSATLVAGVPVPTPLRKRKEKRELCDEVKAPFTEDLIPELEWKDEAMKRLRKEIIRTDDADMIYRQDVLLGCIEREGVRKQMLSGRPQDLARFQPALKWPDDFWYVRDSSTTKKSVSIDEKDTVVVKGFKPDSRIEVTGLQRAKRIWASVLTERRGDSEEETEADWLNTYGMKQQ